MAVKIALYKLPPLLISGLRFFIAGSVILFILQFTKIPRPSKKQILNAMYIGVLLSGIGNCTYAYAINHVPSGLVALMGATQPMWIFLLDRLFFGRSQASLVSILGIILGMVGMIYLMDPFSNMSTEIDPKSAILIFVGSITWCYGSLKSSFMDMPKHYMYSIGYQLFFGGCFGLLSSLALETHQVSSMMNVDTSTILSMAYLIIVGTFIGYSSYIWLIKNADPILVSSYAYINPIIAILLGWYFLNESITVRTTIASILTLTSVILLTYSKKNVDQDV